MMTSSSGKELILDKVTEFERNTLILKKKGHGETNIRSNYIDVLFEALGWEMKSHFDVVREFSQKDASGTKKVDYAFKINGRLKFFVEAKEASIDLVRDKDSIYQAKRYAYSTNGKAPIVILTDFEEFRVFNVLKAPVYDNPDRELMKPFSMTFDQYPEKWEMLWGIFSKEAVSGGSLEKLRGKIDKNTKTMDVDFLEQITGWREDLARNIAIRNKTLLVDEINEAVQRILDRLLFIRNLEDREIEPENTLLEKTQKAADIYRSLVPIFKRLDNVYNGLLFKPHFSETLAVDDKTIKDIIRSMCYPVSPFQFDVIEPEILGRIYERFLGSKIRLTENHQAKIEEKIEVRKAGGVYYTPEYIVNYIVEHTVGKKIDGLNPEEIKQIKIVDPACGSGSFLLGAYSCLLEHHQKWYAAHRSDKRFQKEFYLNKNGELVVTLEKRGDILRNNLFGVDIDQEATEVAIMSLYLKMLDDGFDKGEKDLFFIKGHVLPDMAANIQCGNSLIDREKLFQFSMFGVDDIKPFDWDIHFSDVFKKGGFDIVLGNPPYIRIQEMQAWASKVVDIYRKSYLTGQKGNFDIYVLFIEKGLSLLNKEGLLGMILPNKFFMAEYGLQLRKLVFNHIYHIVDFGDQQVFENATTYTNLLFLAFTAQSTFSYAKIKNLNLCTDNLEKAIHESAGAGKQLVGTGIVENSSLSESTWQFSFGKDKTFFEKLLKDRPTLDELTDKIMVGLQTSADPVYILEFRKENQNSLKLYSKGLDEEVEIEKKILKPLLKGKEIKRYSTPEIFYWLIFPYEIIDGKAVLIDKKTFEIKYSLCWEYLNKNRNRLLKRADLDTSRWWEYPYPKNLELFSERKLITQVLASRASYTADLEGKYYFVGGGNAGGYGVKLKPEYEHLYHYVLGILNSAVIDSYLKHISTQFRGGYYSYAKRFIEKLPIYLPDENDKLMYEKCQKIGEMVKLVLQLKLDSKKASDAEFLEKKIDELVYQLYGLTEEEKNIVEAG